MTPSGPDRDKNAEVFAALARGDHAAAMAIIATNWAHFLSHAIGFVLIAAGVALVELGTPEPDV